jgi:hypothetical protein
MSVIHFVFTDVDLPTPRYNRSIAVDLTISQNEQLRMQTLDSQKELQDGIMLLKVWLRQRGLDQVHEKIKFNHFVVCSEC